MTTDKKALERMTTEQKLLTRKRQIIRTKDTEISSRLANRLDIELGGINSLLEMDDLSKIEIAVGSLEEAILADKPPSHL